MFSQAIHGLGGRLRLRGREDMLCGKRRSPMEYMAELLFAGRHAGLSKAWALRLVGFLRLLIERLWSDDRTPIGVLEIEEEKAEGATNIARLRWQQNPTPENWNAYVAAQRIETAAEESMMAGYGLPVECH